MAEKKEKRYVSDNAQLVAEWDWVKNDKLKLNPQYLLEGSNKKVYWICSSCGNEWMAQIQKRAVRGQGCPNCYKNKKYEIQQAFLYSRIEKEGSFADKYPELLKEWDLEENDKKSLNPYQLLEKSNKRVSWICSVCKSKWETQLEKRTIRRRI